MPTALVLTLQQTNAFPPLAPLSYSGLPRPPLVRSAFA